MNSLRTLGLLVFMLLSCAAGQVPQASAQKDAKKNPAFAAVKDDPALPRVLLIGDSISIGYTVPTRELLKGKANVHRIPENGGPTINGLKKLSAWLGDGRWDVIHFNWGLHDLKMDAAGKHQVPPAEYEKNLRELVQRLKATKAKLIWASTTPVPEGNVNPPRKNSDVEAYNRVALQVMKESGVAIDDLYGFALPRLKEIQRPVNVHFTDDGSKALAKQVAASIEKALSKR
jgi:acyl-CoA thioesterase-1